jgi:hypothetical protein
LAFLDKTMKESGTLRRLSGLTMYTAERQPTPSVRERGAAR